MEIERKFLLREPWPKDLYRLRGCRITQAYLSRDPVIRIRSITPLETGENPDSGAAGGEFVLTVKGKGLSIREEWELALTREQFERLLSKTEGDLLVKTRYFMPLENGITAEIDVFDGKHSGLALVEVEFEEEESMRLFSPPEWFGEEVTDNPAYHNSELSRA